MVVKKQRLGRGLDSLLSGVAVNNPSKETATNKLNISQLQSGQYQPRQSIDQEALEELAQSIISQGIIQPIVVRKVSKQKYEIIAGERRWQAAKLANLTEVPVIIREVEDKSAIAMSLIENIQRENLNPIEEASSLQRLIEEFGLTQQKTADAVGKSRPAVTNLLRLLSLPQLVKEMLANSQIEMGHARALLALPEIQQSPVAITVNKKNLTVRETENLIRKMLANKAETKTIPKDPNITKLENDLEDILNTKVTINARAGKKGNITIAYNSFEELDGILAHIK